MALSQISLEPPGFSRGGDVKFSCPTPVDLLDLPHEAGYRPRSPSDAADVRRIWFEVLQPAFSHTPLDRITQAQVDRVVDRLKSDETVSPTDLALIRRVGTHLMKLAFEKGMTDCLVSFGSASRPKRFDPNKGIPDVNRSLSILVKSLKDKHSGGDRLLVALIAYMAMDWEEAIALQLRDVKDVRRINVRRAEYDAEPAPEVPSGFLVFEGKAYGRAYGGPREVWTAPNLRPALAAQIALQKQRFPERGSFCGLFELRNRQGMSKRKFNRTLAWRAAARAAGLEGLHIDDLPLIGVRAMIERGVPLEVACKASSVRARRFARERYTKNETATD